MGPGFGGMAYAPRVAGGIHGFGGMIFPFFGFLFFMAVVALVIWLIVRAGRAHRPAAAAPLAPQMSAPADTATQIVRERLARGEVTPEEYDGLIDALDRTR